MLRKKSLADQLLGIIADFTDDMTISRRRIRAKTAMYYDDFKGHPTWQKNRRRAPERLARLKRTGYVRDVRIGKRLALTLTVKGRRYALMNRIAQGARPLPKNLRCYVSFDIPESQRHLRHELRVLLAELGFRKEHQSLWSAKADYVDPLFHFIHYARADRWIKVFLGDPLPQ